MESTFINSLRYTYTIGPAPEGWTVIDGCSAVIPHREYHDGAKRTDEWELDDDMNLEHYDGVRYVVSWQSYDEGEVLGVFDTLFEADTFKRSQPPERTVVFWVEAWWRNISLPVPFTN